MEKIIYQGQHFYTASGKEILFNGINVLCRKQQLGYIYPELSRAIPWFQKCGFNFIRLGIFWDGVEPEPGQYNETYLNRIHGIVDTAEKYGIYVMLDMHQDLFSVKFIDGAPEWATLDDGAVHPQDCNVWYLAYFQSDAVINAADHFWADSPAPDGTGLIDHYQKMWEMLALYFRDCANIIALEPMNEPFMGSLARNAFGQAMAQVMEKYPDFNIADPLHVKAEQQAMFLSIMESRFQEFDHNVLMPFYRRIANAIHKNWAIPVATGGNIFCSTDIATGLEPIYPDRILQIYAPHGYDSVVDTDQYDAYNTQNVDRLFAGKRNTQNQLNLPVIIGEWGAFPSQSFTNRLILHMNGIIEKYLWGSAYCEYHPGMENDPNFSALKRAFPAKTPGQLISYHYEPKTQQLTVEFEKASSENDELLCYCPFKIGSVSSDSPVTFSSKAIDENAYFCLIQTSRPGRHQITICGKAGQL